jgi:ribosomal protein S18 acetylase RimI-like enzyme
LLSVVGWSQGSPLHASLSSPGLEGDTGVGQKHLVKAGTVTFRHARWQDLSKVAALQVYEYFGFDMLYPLRWMDELNRLQRSYSEKTTNHIMYLAELFNATNVKGTIGNGKKRLIGFVDIDCRQERADISTPAPYLSDLIVAKSSRNQGIARALIAMCEQKALDWQYYSVFLKVDKTNEAAYKLYENLGYRELWQATETIVVMKKDLDKPPGVEAKLLGES